MHGLMFREFFLFAEDATSKGFVKDMISVASNTDAGGYDAPGPFDQEELIGMMRFLAQRTGYDFEELCHDFGRRLFHRFTVLHPELFEDQTMALDFLQGIEAHIHDQVRALVPKSQPPRFDVSRPNPEELVMHYRSKRPFASLCAGLIEAALEHFGADAQVHQRQIGTANSEAVFTITTNR